MPFFSIVMPVYNAEQYIERAIQSILAQRYCDFELIIVDDGAKDNSLQICHQHALKDHRICIISMKQNSGASAARNKGIEKAKGKYITFVDADDWIDVDWLNKAYETLADENISCLKMGVIEEYIDQQEYIAYSRQCKPDNGQFTHPEDIKREIVLMELIPVFGYLCNGFYLNRIIKERHININEEYKVNEDFDFNIRYFKYCSSLKCQNYCGYHYAKRLTHSLSSEQKYYTYSVQMMKIRALLALYSKIDSVPPLVRKKIFWIYTRFSLALLVRATDMNQYAQQWREIERDILYKWYLKTEFDDVPFKQKVLVCFLKRGNGILLYSLIHMIWAIKTKLPFLFAKVKK